MSHQLKQKLPKLKDIIESTRTQSEWDIIRGFKNDTNKMSKKLGDDFRKSFALKAQGFQTLDIGGTGNLPDIWIRQLDQLGYFNYPIRFDTDLQYAPFFSVSQGAWYEDGRFKITPYNCLVGDGGNLPDKKFDLIARYIATFDPLPLDARGFLIHLMPDGQIHPEEIIIAKHKAEFWDRVHQYHHHQKSK